MVKVLRRWGSEDPGAKWGRRGPTNSHLYKWILVLFISLIFTPIVKGSFFRSLFDVPQTCNDVTGLLSCTFLLSCYYDNGTPVKFCGGGFLYACCDKPIASVRSDVMVRNDVINDVLPMTMYREHSVSKPRVRSFSRSKDNPYFSRPSLMEAYSRIPLETATEESSVFVPSYLEEYDEEAPSGGVDRPQHFPLVAPKHTHYNEPECGIQKTNQFSKRIIGGNEAQFAEFPWLAHIRISGYQCGGVLVNKLFVATAAHCVHKARLNQIAVFLGEHDTKDTGLYYEPYPREAFGVVEKRTHPLFKYMLTQPDRYDVAVLRLTHPASYRQNIVPICLPSPTDDFEGTVGVVAGWGKTDTSFGKTGTNILRKVTVPVISNSECLRWHHSKGIDVRLHYEMFCAGHSDGKMDACLGDSGGPLVVHHRGRWRLAGIISAGFGCAVDHQPGIYHKISVTTEWIADNIRI